MLRNFGALKMAVFLESVMHNNGQRDKLVRKYTERRVRRWLVRRTGQRGTGIAQIPDEYLYRTLGLYNVPVRLSDLSRAKV